jgi:peptide/nickel transport system substrate-binding protein
MRRKPHSAQRRRDGLFRFAVGISLVFAVALVALSAATASRMVSSAGIADLRVGVTGTDSNLDLAQGGQDYALGLELLNQVGADGKLKPWLAQSITTPNKVTYDYHLRPGVKFWDGHPLTAADVVASFKYESGPKSYSAYAFTSLKDVKALNSSTVRVTLKHPDAFWQWTPATGRAVIFEKKFFLDHKSTFGRPGTLEMGTGPFIPTKLDPTTGLEFKANPHYWGGKVTTQRISLKFFADETSMALAFRAGEVDVAPGIDDPNAFAATSGGSVNIVKTLSCAFAGVLMDTQHAPWSDVHLRRAVAYALNRKQLINVRGSATPNYSIDPPTLFRALATRKQINAMLGSSPLLKNAGNVAAARQELAKSAYPNGVTADFPILDSGKNLVMAQAIAGQLTQIGINLNVKPLNFDQWYAIVKDPNRNEQFQYIEGSCDSPDPNEHPKYLLGAVNAQPGQFNLSNYAPPDFDKLLTASLTTLNPAKRFQVYTKIFQRLATDVPMVALFNPTINLAISKNYSWPTFNKSWYQRPWAVEVKKN